MYLTSIFFFVALLSSFNLFAAQTISSSARLTLTQSTGTTETSNTHTSINTTSITPRYSLAYKKRKINLNANYSLTASNDHENDSSEVNHQLNLIAQYQHNPDNWTSGYATNIFQKNISNTGVLIPNTSISTTENTDLYIIHKLDTLRTFDLSRTHRLTTSITISSQGFKDQTASKNAQISLQHEARQILPSINITSSLVSHNNLDSDATNNTLKVNTYYNINSRLDSFLSLSQNISSDNTFDDTRYTIGLNWRINTKSAINFDIGKYGDTDTWSLKSSLTNKRSSFLLNHSEEIAPANLNLLNFNTNNNSNLLSSINSDLKYIKTTVFSFNHRTRRLVTSVSFTYTKEFTDLGITSDKTINASSLALNYRLSALKSISYSYAENTVETTTNNQLIEHSVNWSATLNKQSHYNVRLSYTEQNSDNNLVDYSKNQLDFNYTYIF